MNALDRVADLPSPRWDGSRVLFEIADGDERSPCAISRIALQDFSQRRLFKAAELLLCFVNDRPHIEAIALGKLWARSGDLSGPLSICRRHQGPADRQCTGSDGGRLHGD